MIAAPTAAKAELLTITYGRRDPRGPSGKHCRHTHCDRVLVRSREMDPGRILGSAAPIFPCDQRVGRRGRCRIVPVASSVGG